MHLDGRAGCLNKNVGLWGLEGAAWQMSGGNRTKKGNNQEEKKKKNQPVFVREKFNSQLSLLALVLPC